MSLKIYRGQSVWVPEDITPLQQFALKWRPLGSIGSLVLPVLSATYLSMLLCLPLMPATDVDWSVVGPMILIGGCIVLPSVIAFTLNSVAAHVYHALQTNPAFRFQIMQDETPSFRVLSLFNAKNKMPLEPKQRQALDAWLEERWKHDYDPGLPFTTWRAHAEWLHAQLEERITTFKGLPLHFPSDFDTDCNDLLREHRQH